jgi:beta-galactosidase
MALVFFGAGLPASAGVPPEVEDPQCLGVHKEPPHATLMPYGDLAEALAARRNASSFCRSLNGLWKFHWVSHPDQRPLDFYKPEFDAGAWKEIPVPSCWQLLGYGTPYYRNFGYTFQKDWPRVLSDPPADWTAAKERDPVGSYRREFDLPAAWLSARGKEGRRIFITFDGVDSAFFLWINGQKVGYSVNSRNAAEFDITPYVRPGTNLVAAEVYRYSAGSYLEDQDMWRLSGIFRNVTLWSAPEVHIRDFFVQTDFDWAYSNATLRVTAKIRNYGQKPAPARDLTLFFCDRPGLPTMSATVPVPALAAGEEKSVAVQLTGLRPDKWTAETPKLYTTVLILGGSESDVGPSEILSARTGFRTIEIKGRVFTINGVPVKLKGANRHENWPDTGHYVPEEKMIRDLEVLKQCNCNHVRTCHYSDDPRWYELCDEYGIYLTAEANLESHGYGFGRESLSHPKAWEAAHVARNVANVESFKNHASVVIWSMGNEAGPGPNFLAALRAIKGIDTSRPVHYEGFGIGRGNPADIDSAMYTHPNDVARIAVDPNLTKPFYMCEYAHAMFNSMGAVGEYNDIFDKYPNLMGGAIWEWEDQGVWNRRDPKHVFLAYGGGFGEVPNDHYFIHKGVVFSDRSPKPHYPELKRAYQWIGIEPIDLAKGTFAIHNKYQFLNLDRFQPVWTLTEDGSPLAAGELPVLSLAAGETGRITVGDLVERKLGQSAKAGAEYFLRIAFQLRHDEKWAKAGFEIAAAQFKLPIATPPAQADANGMKPLKLRQEQGGQAPSPQTVSEPLANGGDGASPPRQKRVTVEGDGFAITFDKAEGTIARLVRDGVNLLADGGGPKLHLWRAPHRNDDMWAYGDWEKCGLRALKRHTVRCAARQTGPSTVCVDVAVQADGRNGFSVLHSARYTIYGDGSIAVDNTVAPHGPRIPLARLGVRLLLDKRLDQFAYLGRGPMENYADRKRGFDVGLYASSVREQQTPYAKPMECGNHEDVRWAALTGRDLPGLMARADTRLLQVSALPYTDEELEPVEYTVDLPESKATVLCVADRTLGAGSAGCGPRPLDPYIVWSEPAEFSYVLRLLPAGAHDLSAQGRLAPPQNRVKEK